MSLHKYAILQVYFALGLVKMEVWWSDGQMKLASEILFEIISNQKQFKKLRLQDKPNNELKMA